MKILVLFFVSFLLLSSGQTNTVSLEIDGYPNCLEKNKTYTIRVLSDKKLLTDEYYTVVGSGVSLTKADGNYVYKCKAVSSGKQVKLSVFFRNDRKNISKQVFAQELSICN